MAADDVRAAYAMYHRVLLKELQYQRKREDGLIILIVVMEVNAN